MRPHSFVNGEFYHVYSHTISDLPLFRNDSDYIRFLQVLFSSNGQRAMPHLGRANGLNLVSDIRDEKINLGEPLVDIISFCLMPNHFHLLLREIKDGNISIFMHRILVSFSKYINIKYERRGHVFERTFNSKIISDNEYLLRVSSYIHLNSKDIREWHKKEALYPWSSFQDYVAENRWGRLIKNEEILSQFENNKDLYKDFVEESRNDDCEDFVRN